MKRLALIVALCLLPELANSRPIFYDGNKLYSQLASCLPTGKRIALKSQNISLIVDCEKAQAYVMGIHDSLQMSENAAAPCTPDGVDSRQTADVVDKWLNENPARRHEFAPALIQSALMEAWPCPEE